MAYKMLVTDIDDTLLNSHHQITEGNKRAIQSMLAAGYQVVLASGRPPYSVMKIAEELGLGDYQPYIIAFNGAVVQHLHTDEILYQQTLDLEEQTSLIQFLKDHGLAVLAYQGNEIIVDHANEYTHVEEALTGLPTRYDETYCQQALGDQFKFIGVGDPTMVKRLESESGGRFGAKTRLTTSKSFYLEVVHQDVSKGTSLLKLCEHMGIHPSEVIAIGDGNNDLQMLQAAGLGVAMANGSAELRSAADEITLTNDDDGVAYIIDKYFLKH